MNTQPVSVDISELILRLDSFAAEGGEHARDLADAAHALRRSVEQSAIHDEAIELRTAVACRDLVLGEHLGESDLALDVMYNRAIDDAVGAIEQRYQFGEETPKSTFFH